MSLKQNFFMRNCNLITLYMIQHVSEVLQKNKEMILKEWKMDESNTLLFTVSKIHSPVSNSHLLWIINFLPFSKSYVYYPDIPITNVSKKLNQLTTFNYRHIVCTNLNLISCLSTSLMIIIVNKLVNKKQEIM